MVEFIEFEKNSYVDQIYILLRKNTSITHIITKKNVLTKRLKRGKGKPVQFGTKKKSYVYVILYDSRESKVRKNISEVEKSGIIY